MRRVAAGLMVGLLTAMPALAQQVFNGDPTDPVSGAAYPMMPGVALVLPGADEDFGTADDIIDTGLTGDVDLVIRVGSILSPAIPPPSLAPGGAPVSTATAGGGSSGQGSEAAFTVMASDGTGTYGNVLAGSDLDLRPVAVYAFADLDGDGRIGPSNIDGSADNALELQEVTAYGGRQVGAFESGRFAGSLGIETAAPASMGGLTVALTAGAWTGSDPEQLFTDGPFILTRWPLFPPLDPKDLLGGGNAPPPDPEAPSEIEWDIERNYLPAPGHALLGTPFAVSTTGSEPTTDQLHVVSGSAVSARIFAEATADKFLARARPRLRVAPASGGGRALVLPVERATLAIGGGGLALRVLPVDLFANVADPAAPLQVVLAVSGPASILSPDEDGDPKTELFDITSAAGRTIVLGDDGSGSARLTVTAGGLPAQSVVVNVGASADSDGDSIANDGNASGLSGDFPCDQTSAGCDDNCPAVRNPTQMDSDHDGLGDCCDGTCIDDPLSTACGECELPAGPTTAALTAAKLSFRFGSDGDDDRINARLAFAVPLETGLAPDIETVALVVTQAGSDGFLATLPSLFVDLLRAAPSYRYVDRAAAVDGVTKSQMKGSAAGAWRMALKAKGPSLAGLAAGTAALTLMIGDDLFEGTLDCAASGSRLSCQLVP